MFQIFDQNHGLTSLEKSQFLTVLTFSFLQSKKAFFISRIWSKTFSSHFAKNKKMEIFQIFDQNHGLTPLEKSQFLTVLTFRFFIVKKTFFISRISLNGFCQLILTIIKRWKNFKFLTKNHGLTPLEKFLFLAFLTFCFLQSKKAFFLSRISSNTFCLLILPKMKSWKNFKFMIKTMD